MPVFMQYGSIQGDSKSSNHANWIELDSISWGVSRGIGSATASEADREGTTPSVGEIVVTKKTDVASNDLLRAALAGGPAGAGTTVQIDFTTSSTSGDDTVYMSFSLTNTLISGYSVSSGGDTPHESLTLNFTVVQITYTPTGASNAAGANNVVNYDLAAQKLNS
jgi:type VI secretion system secreted protein Hcp